MENRSPDDGTARKVLQEAACDVYERSQVNRHIQHTAKCHAVGAIIISDNKHRREVKHRAEYIKSAGNLIASVRHLERIDDPLKRTKIAIQAESSYDILQVRW